MRGRAARSTGDLPRARLVDRHVEDPGGAHDDRLQLVVVVVVESGDEPEAVAQRTGDHAGAGGGADEREARQRQADARRGRALADDDVELEVLHRRIEDLLDGPGQAVDLVDEQDVALVELGEDGRQVAGAFERRTGRDVQVHSHLGGDDAGERGLAEPGRPGEQQVVDRLAAVAGGLEHDREVLLELALADELGEGTRPQPGVDDLLDVVADARVEELVTHDRPPAASARRAAASARRRRTAARATPRGSRRSRSRGRPAPRARRRPPTRRSSSPPASSTGTERRLLSSTSSRSAVLRPTPGTRVSDATSAPATMSTSAVGGCVARIAIASAGPTPWVAISTWNVARSSRARNPYSVWASSRMWWWTYKKALLDGSSSASTRGETTTWYPTPPTSISTVPSRARSSTTPRSEPIMPASSRCDAVAAAADGGGDAAAHRSRREVAQRQRRGVGGVGGLRSVGEAEPRLHHLLDLLLAGASPAGDGVLHLVRRVLHDLAPAGGGLGERQPAHLGDAHRGAHVDLEEDLLDGDGVGFELGEQRRQLAAQRGQPAGQRVAGRSADHAERHGDRAAGAATVEDGVAAAGEAGVDAEHAHGPVGTGGDEHRFVG